MSTRHIVKSATSFMFIGNLWKKSLDKLAKRVELGAHAKLHTSLINRELELYSRKGKYGGPHNTVDPR
jgi:hypothetical protein